MYAFTYRIEKCEEILKIFEKEIIEKIEGAISELKVNSNKKEEIRKYNLILLKAAKGSGKTIFCKLLKAYLSQAKQEKNVFLIDLLGMDGIEKLKFKMKQSCGFDDLEKMNHHFAEKSETCYLIFDEIQLLYPENAQDKKYNPFWQQIKMLLQFELPSLKIFMVSSYTPNEVGGSTPPQLTEAYILQIPFLYCTKAEMNELNTFFNTKTCESLVNILQIKEETKEEILKYTGGHIGIVQKVYEKIFHKFKPKTSLTTSKIVSQKEIFHLFYSREMLLAITTYRAFDGITSLTKNQKNILRELFFATNSELEIEPIDKDDLKRLLLCGIVDYTDVNSKQITWSFSMMETYVMKHIFVSRKRPTNDEWEGKKLEDFLMEVLSRMSPKNICAGFRTRQGKKNNLIEKQLQADFFKAITSIIPHEVSIFSEASHTVPSERLSEVMEQKKKIDFYINEKHGWAIELVVEDGNVREHYKRFLKEGKYSKAKLRNWAVVHFVSQNYKEHHKNIDCVWRVQFLDEECKTAEVSPWIKKNKGDKGELEEEESLKESIEEDEGKRGETKKINLRGDFLADDTFKPLQLSLRLEDNKGVSLKKKLMEEVSDHFPAFLSEVKRLLQIEKETEIQCFMEIGRDEVEITKHNLNKLKDGQTVFVRLKPKDERKEEILLDEEIEKLKVNEQEREMELNEDN